MHGCLWQNRIFGNNWSIQTANKQISPCICASSNRVKTALILPLWYWFVDFALWWDRQQAREGVQPYNPRDLDHLLPGNTEPTSLPVCTFTVLHRSGILIVAVCVAHLEIYEYMETNEYMVDTRVSQRKCTSRQCLVDTTQSKLLRHRWTWLCAAGWSLQMIEHLQLQIPFWATQMCIGQLVFLNCRCVKAC